MAHRFGPFGSYTSTFSDEDEARRERADKEVRPALKRALAAIEQRKIEALDSVFGMPADKIVRLRAEIRADAKVQEALAWQYFDEEVAEILRDGEASEATSKRWDFLIDPSRASILWPASKSEAA